MINLEDFYEDIPLAHQYFAQGEFEKAIDIYSGILNKINPDEETVPYLYINYANCLIKNSNQYFLEEIQNIHSGFDLSERQIIENDLEMAWNMLESCRSFFTILKEDFLLGKTFFLLGEISLLNNEFRDALRDFIECENIYKKLQADCTEYIDLYFSMSNAYEFLEDYDMAIKMLRDLVEIFKKSNLDYLDLLDRIVEIKSKKDKPVVENKEEFEDLSEVKDINKNKKRIL
ncbi:hypothetical protein NCER_100606 [Vairimorpha ceranae BRL01]|uniref:Tetratricopeptide SHNi-TPR domain-containing protein n=2 Tax=Vairimorpha ceranae TaxID=40302 RepID=C4V800_VAIC1|nr:histone-binding protein n1 n2 [Vairimorpha ceranae]EEQ82650.1 hypothetical protein NCER_100606 [Vairimorpha ceranae BRL01]KAF5140881.1 hypothetical protein G9O61_00g008710 [Vairimorpha ceranae]KKO75583.1 histone-binding protein n1 n2 [Vairimorpha ceranae]